MFESISKSLVNQRAEHTEENAVEVMPTSVSSLLDATGAIESAVVFVNVGTGVGNVVCAKLPSRHPPWIVLVLIELRSEILEVSVP